MKKIVRESLNEKLDLYDIFKGKSSFKYRNKINDEQLAELINISKKYLNLIVDVEGNNYISAYNEDLQTNKETWHYWGDEKRIYYGDEIKSTVDKILKIK